MATGLVFDAINDIDLRVPDDGVSGVADLATHLGVEWSLIEYEERVFRCGHDIHDFGVGDGGRSEVVADKLGGLGGGGALGSADDDVGFAGCAAAITLFFHFGFKTDGIDGQPAFGSQ